MIVSRRSFWREGVPGGVLIVSRACGSLQSDKRVTPALPGLVRGDKCVTPAPPGLVRGDKRVTPALPGLVR
eukprot:1183885-Prorocentrum_minimum.AAC.4